MIVHHGSHRILSELRAASWVTTNFDVAKMYADVRAREIDRGYVYSFDVPEDEVIWEASPDNPIDKRGKLINNIVL